MSCCAPDAGLVLQAQAPTLSDAEIRLSARKLGDGISQIDLSVPAIHCGACIQAVESALARLRGVTGARVNLSTRRVSVRWEGEQVPPIVDTLTRIGYPPHVFGDGDIARDDMLAELLRAVAVAGFAAANIMLLSVSVWSGAEGATRDLFHWVSALIALPALIFAGRIYYRSAWSVLRHGRMNMDVPIAIGVTLAYAMSLYETITHGSHAYFDAAVSLLFFLLIGRTLDHFMRNRARQAVIGLARLAPRGAIVIAGDGSREYRQIDEIRPGARLLIAAGERIPVDARVVDGASDMDCSLVTGESSPRAVGKGAVVRAGTLNLTGPLTLEAVAAASDSFLAEMLRMMEAAEGGRARYRRIADRVSALYAPVVHLTAFLTFLGWMFVDGDWHQAITVAIAVLIITCPCALGLAVPIVQVVAARRLFERGVMVKDGSGIERLAEIDFVAFDKTGTLTLGRPLLTNQADLAPSALALAAELAAHSHHPLSQAIARHAAGATRAGAFTDITEYPGCGIEGSHGGAVWRLGRAGWATADDTAAEGTVLSRGGAEVSSFEFEDVLRADAVSTVSQLKAMVGPVEMLSGDTQRACRPIADLLQVDSYAARLTPGGKVDRIRQLGRDGRRVLMVGDGLNDAPALGMAHVSIAPASAADVGRNAADFVFLRESLAAVPFAIDIARRAGGLVRQNLGLAIAYNALAVPIAILGYVTPLIAAVAMSASSLLVIANALRLVGFGRTPAPAGQGPALIPAAGQSL
jgi:P-type Cu2+ transporter